MIIDYNDLNGVFHLNNGTFSYILKVTEDKQLVVLYYGKAVNINNYFEEILAMSQCGFSLQHPSGLMYEKLQLAYGTFGKYALKEEAFLIKDDQGVMIHDFEYFDFKILNNSTLIIRLKEKTRPLWIHLKYRLIHDMSALVKSVAFVNETNEPYEIASAMSASYGLNARMNQVMTFNGTWIKEFSTVQNELSRGRLSFTNLSGVSTHTYQPFLALSNAQTTDDIGEVFGFALIYSGNFTMTIDKDIFNQTTVQLGISAFNFNWSLEPNHTFMTPEVVSVYSDKGFNGMTQTFHRYFLNEVMGFHQGNQYSQVLLNTWEAFYFDIDETRLIEFGKRAKKLGVELLVIDDGWFASRSDDTSGLGAWQLDCEKFPNGIQAIKDQTGLEIGLWIEPEMTNSKNGTVIGPGENLTPSRNQYVLDFTNDEVVDDVFEKVSSILKAHPISFIKWDANRPISEPCSKTIVHQGELYHRYMLGVYKLAQKIKDAFPHITIESCSAGGGRANAGMLPFAVSTWLSDNTDACERIRMQQSAAMFLPLRAIGSHVTAVPNHQMLRETSLKMRGDVAFFGTFGYELDFLKLTPAEEKEVVRQIDFFKKHRKLIQSGDYYRLLGNLKETEGEYAHMVVSGDKNEALVGVYQILCKPNWEGMHVLLRGLNENTFYCVGEKTYSGCYLMNIGINLRQIFTGVQKVDRMHQGRFGYGDFTSEVFYIKKKD